MVSFKHALHQAYPNAVRTDGDIAYDENGNVVEWDVAVVEAKQAELNAILESQIQAQETAKQSAISKLAALGLTADEVKAIIG